MNNRFKGLLTRFPYPTWSQTFGPIRKFHFSFLLRSDSSLSRRRRQPPIPLYSFDLRDKMIKRRFYRLDHDDRDASDPSSSSGSEREAEDTEEESEDDAIPDVEQEDEAIPEVEQEDEAGSTSSGYESEDGSGNVGDANSSGLLFSQDDAGIINERQKLINRELSSERGSDVLGRKSNVLVEKKPLSEDMLSYVLKCKSVFKCRICPTVICLTEDTLRDHLQSKRHARSEKLLSEGRLKAMLNNYGEIENQEVSQNETEDTEDNAKKIHKGQKQHKKRMRKKKNDNANSDDEIENQEVSEIETKDTEDNAKKNHRGQKRHKRMRKKKNDNANTRKMLSTKGPDKRRRKK